MCKIKLFNNTIQILVIIIQFKRKISDFIFMWNAKVTTKSLTENGASEITFEL